MTDSIPFGFPIVGEYRHCEHGFDHPSWPHSCDGCWCDDDRDKQYLDWPKEQDD